MSGIMSEMTKVANAVGGDATNENTSILKCTHAINSGKVVIFPTETVLALACNAFDEAAVKSLFNLKCRSKDKPIAIFVKNVNEISKIAQINSRALKLARKFMPGPLTIVLRLNPNAPISNILHGGRRTIGIRIPNNKIALKVLQMLDRPIAATSVNISGRSAALNLSQVPVSIISEVGFAINSSGSSFSSTPSTVVDFTGVAPKIIRHGEITQEQIESALSAVNLL